MTARTFITSIAIALMPVLSVAQTGAKWLTSEARNKNFPASQYISGYATVTIRSGETQADALVRASNEASKQAASSIRIHVEGVAEMVSQEDETNGNLQFMSQYTEYTRQSYNADIAGLKTETHLATSDGQAHAFAYVLRTDLASYYKSQIDLQLNKVDDVLLAAQSATVAGQKLRAKKQCTAALEPLAKAEYAQSLLTAVASSDREGLQVQRCSQLKQKLFQQLVDLEQSVFVYIKCTESNFGTPSTLLANQIKGLLAKNQCSFCDSPEEANYTLTITATTRKHDVDNPNFKFTYADVQVDLYSAYKHMSVFSDEFSVKGGATTHQTAGRNALKDAAPKVWESIKPWILNE